MGKRASGATCEADELALALTEEWVGVTYNEAHRVGHARVPNVGYVKFKESSNDPAVVVEVPAFKFKGSAREAKKILAALSKLIGSV